jgi:hypothetical protein
MDCVAPVLMLRNRGLGLTFVLTLVIAQACPNKGSQFAACASTCDLGAREERAPIHLPATVMNRPGNTLGLLRREIHELRK